MASVTDSERRQARLTLVMAQIGAIIVVVPLLIVLSLTDWPYASAFAVLCSLTFLVAGVASRDAFLTHVWLFGLLFGVAELAVDNWLVNSTGTLSYDDYAARGGPMWSASPAFMPLAWQVLVAHIAILGDAVSHWPARPRVLFALAIGAVYIPICEALSIAAGFWSYERVPTIASVPVYIVIGETLLALVIIMMLPTLNRRRWTTTVATAAVACTALWVGYAAGLRWL